VRRLARDGLLDRRYLFGWYWNRTNGETISSIGIRPEDDRVILSYRHGEGERATSQEYAVRLERTRCNYGGERVWFRCPAQGCGRRVAILYNGKVFACRHCYRLSYECQRESLSDRADSRAWKIRQRCVERGRQDWGGLLDPVFRPKGMHQRTFDRLERQYEFYSRTSIEAFAAKMKVSAEELLGGW